jgi:amidase
LEALHSSGEPILPMSKWIIDETTGKPLTVRETWQWQKKRNEFRKEYARVWNETVDQSDSKNDHRIVDVILCPAGPGAAPPLECARYWGYTAVWNLLDYPALIFPVTQVDPVKDIPDSEYKPMNERDAYNHQLCKNFLVKLTTSLTNSNMLDDTSVYNEAPVCLQLVGRRFDDEKVR